jgi:ABC-type glycerol-3-phosphate transport system substrate-binding protein
VIQVVKQGKQFYGGKGMNKNRLIALGILGSLLTAAAFGQQTVTLRFWTNQVAQSESLDKEIALFEKANPGIKIERTTTAGAQYTQVFNLAHRSNNAPDLFTLTFDGLSGGARTINDNGWVAYLDKYATAQWKSNFPRNTFVEGVNVWDGKVYSAPWRGRQPSNNINLFINTKVFKDAGLVDSSGRTLIPLSWDDVRRYSKQITTRLAGKSWGWGFGAKQGDYALTLQSWGARTSGAVCTNYACLNYHTGRYEFGKPVWAEWFDHWFDLKEDGSIYPQSAVVNDEQARVLFAEGKFGMYVNGPFVPNSLEQTNPNFDDYIVVAVPTQGGIAESFNYYGASSSYVAISPQSKNPDAAWKFFSFLNSLESGKRWASYGEGLRVWPETAQFLKGRAKTIAELGLKYARALPGFNTARPQLADVRQRTLTQVLPFYTLAALNGQMKRNEIKSVLNKIEDDMNNELERAVKEAQGQGIKVKLEDFAFPNWTYWTNQSSITDKPNR